MKSVYLQAISYYFPSNCLTNEEISLNHPEWSVEKISTKIGIDNRYISSPNETAVDMAEKAANNLFEEYCVDKDSIDFIILCTMTPDYFLPASACILQNKLGLKEECGAFDYNLGCSGFVYGLGIAKGLIVTGQAKKVLLLTSDTFTKYVHPEDKSCQTLFGDASTASLITDNKCDGLLNAEILNSVYKTIGVQYKDLIVENGAFRNPNRNDSEYFLHEDGSFKSGPNYVSMDGKAIFDFSAQIVPLVVEQTLRKNGFKKDEIDWYVFHQANKFLLNFARTRCGVPQEKFIVDLEDGGNTISCTIPIALKRKLTKIQPKTNLLLCGFGVGLSVAGIVLKVD